MDRGTSPCAVDYEPRKGQDEQKLAELGGLEGEQGKFEGAPRAAGGEAENEHQGDDGTEEGVDADPQLAEARVVDPAERRNMPRSPSRP